MDPVSPSSEPDDVLYWAVADTTANEYTIGLLIMHSLGHYMFSPKHRHNYPETAVGRDETGFEPDYESDVPRLVAHCDIFKLHGDQIMKGYYELALEMVESEGFGLPIRWVLRYVLDPRCINECAFMIAWYPQGKLPFL